MLLQYINCYGGMSFMDKTSIMAFAGTILGLLSIIIYINDKFEKKINNLQKEIEELKK